jgi:cell division protein FtsB
MEALPNTASLEKRVEELEKTVKELERKLEAFTKYFKHQLDMSKPLIMK